MVNSVERDPESKEASHNADLVLPDSIGIVWASEFLACGKVAHIPGIDLMLKFCRLASSTGYPVYLLGWRNLY
ncbi:MAG: WecB/TagA/CpsF family glycosyltransferase [bacterium]